MADMAKIKEVRERTGVGFGDCKKALQESNGDVEGALDYLRKQSAVKAAKKSDRTASEGRLALKISADGCVGAIAEINSETDFAARNERFVQFCEHVIETALVHGAETMPMLENDKNELVSAIGENISIRRVERFETDGGIVAGYLHSTGTVGAIVELSANAGELNKNLAMHITSENPLVVNAEELPAAVVQREEEIFTAQALETGKPENIVKNIVRGKLKKFLSESCLNEQSYIWDRERTVGELLKAQGSTCVRFARYQVGESFD